MHAGQALMHGSRDSLDGIQAWEDYIMVAIRGSGSIQQADKKTNRYKCRKWRIFVSTDEGMKTLTVHGSIKDAKAELEAFKERLRRGTARPGTLGEYTASWLESRQHMGFSPNTLKTSRMLVSAIPQWLMERSMESVAPADIRKAVSEHALAHAPTTTRVWLTALRQIFAQAASDGLIGANPCASVKPPKGKPKERELVDLRELVRKLESMPPCGHAAAYMLMACLGLRCGEALGLDWDAVDFERNTIAVRQNLRRADGTVGATKTAAGNRTLPMPANLRAFLAGWKADPDRAALSRDDAVCQNTNGERVTYGVLRAWGAVRGLPVDMHSLRHANLTMMARCVPSAFDLQRYAGWDSLEMARVYVHDDADALARAVDAFGSALT